MKKIIFLLAFSGIIIFEANAQIKVYSNGDVFAGGTPPAAANADLQVGGLLTAQSLYAGPVVDINAPGRFSLSGASAELSLVDRTVSSFVTVPTAGERWALLSSGGTFRIWSGSNKAIIHNDGRMSLGGALSSRLFTVRGTAFKTQGGSNWDIPSDKRLKKKIKPFKNGLDYVMKMNTVEYEYNGKAGTIDGDFQIGVLAQELKEVAPFMVHEITNYVQSEDDDKEKTQEEAFLGMNPSAIKWMLVSAVQEQQKMIEDKNEEVSELKERLNKVEQLVESLLANNSIDVDLEGHDISEIFISQNRPNPFKESTTFDFILPDNIINANLRISDISGKLLKTVTIEERGRGVININASELPSGSYIYEFITDGISTGVKKMVVAK